MIRRADSIIIVSDGLSDPFEDDDDVFVPRGHLLEVCIEAPLAAFDGAPVQASWLFDVIYQVSQNVADHGSIDLLLQRHGSVSMALDLQDAPKALEDENEQVGVLLAQGAATLPPAFDTPYGEVMLLTVIVLQPAELAYISEAEDKAQSRRDLAAALTAEPMGHWSVAERPAVIPR
ncbi:hypothetical protein [Janthinobacterium sp. RB2P8]|uniref:hypothetical protein n=1 Tax=Janthinobacterium sp. RB2P8 TaxID=3424191 RepID=UPI003F24D3CC